MSFGGIVPFVLYGWAAALVLAIATRALLALVPDRLSRVREAIAAAALVAAPAFALALASGAFRADAPSIRLILPPLTMAAADGSASASEPALSHVLAAAWIAVALLLLAREAVGHAVLFRRRRSWRPVRAELRERHPILSRGRFLTAARGVPMTVGLLRPVTFLPEMLLEREPAQIVDWIAKHELAHARWLDPLGGALARIVRMAFWPIAPLFWIERMIATEMEAAADQAALGNGAGATQRLEYAGALLALAESAAGSSPRAAAALIEGALARRIRRFLVASAPSPLRRSAAAALLAATVVAAGHLPEVRVGEARSSPTGVLAPAAHAPPIESRFDLEVRIVIPLRVGRVERNVVRRE